MARIDWSRPELILACDLVFVNDGRGLRATDPRVRELSDLLRGPWFHDIAGRDGNFRSPSSVQRKTFDIATHLPTYEGKPTKGGRLDEEVIAEFLAAPEALHNLAASIRASISDASLEAALEDLAPTAATRSSAREGAVKQVLSKRRERDPALRRAKIESLIAAGRGLACAICGFDFEQVYGPRGAGYVEIHHRNPLHVTGPVETSLEDLVGICANCHRMIHKGSWISVDELASLLSAR
ncbi:HNH endonuclease [Cellulosimicrobium funkei]|uniref:HNH endonuclease n=1 Tax=Cellulosimicrobium funkei TaxID=264251 RepID=UPI0037DC1B4D